MKKQFSQRELVLKRVLKDLETGFKPTRRKKDTCGQVIVQQKPSSVGLFHSKKPTIH